MALSVVILNSERDDMARNLDHGGWVRRQFNQNGLKPSFRNVVLHVSFIESIVRNESKRGTFDAANMFLRISNSITQSEFEVFDRVRDLRNKLVHTILKKGLTQKEIESCRDALMKKILEAYRSSTFLDDRLFRQYDISRGPSIAYNPPT